MDEDSNLDLVPETSTDLDPALTTAQDDRQRKAFEQESLRKDIDALLQEHPFAQESSYFTRPNRYLGPASTWRSWTESERNVVSALDLRESEDLSVHSYNAFVYKQLASQKNGAIQKHPGFIPGNIDDESSIAELYKLPNTWTAWPLEPDHIAALGESSQDSITESLEDSLIALATKQAKFKWLARPFTPTPTESRSRDWQKEKILTGQSPLSDSAARPKAELGIVEADNAASAEPGTAHSDLSEGPHDESDENEADQLQTFSSQAFGIDSSSESSDTGHENVTEDLRPTFTADDDHARRLLLPSARHTIAKLEDLLTGLHKARKAYASKPVRRRSRSSATRSETEAMDLETADSETDHNESRRGRKRKRSSPHDDSAASGDTSATSRSRSTTRRTRQLGLRDWSDVMGMAALTGWSTNSVARASERCARLFGQNMLFRTFQSPHVASGQSQPATFTESLAYVSSHEEHSDHPPDSHRGSEEPSTHLIRASAPCIRCHSHKIKCDAVQNQTPSDTLVPCSACSTNHKLSLSCSGIRTKLASFPSTHLGKRTCPFPSCSRYTVPFHKRSHLERHLKNVHDEKQPPYPHPRRSPDLPIPESELVCPVRDCSQHRHVYARPTRLYTHIANTHPEVDLDTFKRLQGKQAGNAYRRGRYDRTHLSVSVSRSVSKSRSLSRGNTVSRKRKVQDETDTTSENSSHVDGDRQDDWSNDE